MTDLDRKDQDQDDAGLETLFALARAPVDPPSRELMARILADAAAVDSGRTQMAPQAARGGLFSGLMAALGGWPALGGLAAATVAGLWIGIAPPSGLTGLTDAVWGTSTTISVFSVDDVLGSEGQG